MFKGLSGIKKAVKGGFSAVAEHSSNLAEQVRLITGHIRNAYVGGS